MTTDKRRYTCYECGFESVMIGLFHVLDCGLAHCRRQAQCEARSARSRAEYVAHRRKPMFVRDGDCLVWQGRRNKNGYGQVTVGGYGFGVHRLVYIATHGGEEPPVVRHTCDNPPCAEPTHLLGGTRLDNYRDMVARDRHPVMKDVHEL